MKPKIAIVGTGRWGQNLIREFSQIAEITHTINQSNLADYNIALADKSIVAVVIATPIATHYTLAKQALEAGKHVFLEKPGGQSATELAELIELATAKKLGLQIGYIFLHHPIFKYLTENIITPITNIFTDWQKFGSFHEEIGLNLVCHDLAIINALTNQNPTAQNLLFRLPAISNGDILGLELTYADNTQAIIQINRISNNKQKNITIVTHQTIWLWQDNKLYRSNNDAPYALVYESTASSLTIECATFIEMITTSPKVLYGDIAITVHQSLANF